MSEAALQSAIVDLAHLYGWKVALFRPAKTWQGWQTPVGADGKGWPDLTLVRDRILFVECKSDSGRLTKEQLAWIEALRAGGAEAYVWNPVSWRCGDIQAVLQRVKVDRR